MLNHMRTFRVIDDPPVTLVVETREVGDEQAQRSMQPPVVPVAYCHEILMERRTPNEEVVPSPPEETVVVFMGRSDDSEPFEPQEIRLGGVDGPPCSFTIVGAEHRVTAGFGNFWTSMKDWKVCPKVP